ncbi:MAG: methyltransferase domain-containing protein [Thermoleophilia bacterium]|nr:methyltransferase domain-containing protein [Thermoleophilia bacterium]
MGINDKNNLLARIGEMQRVHLELGCGSRKRDPGAIGIDALDYNCVDLVGDVFEVLNKFSDDSVDAVHSSHFFEHLPEPAPLMNELQRVVKINGLLEIIVPHFTNPYFYSDATHKSQYGLYTFCPFSKDSPFKRQVPSYQMEPHFQIIDVNLIFKSSPPFLFRHAIKKAIGTLVNLNCYTKEFYEENLCYIFPCYEICYSLERI